jgi:hypothetical protein
VGSHVFLAFLLLTHDEMQTMFVCWSEPTVGGNAMTKYFAESPPAVELDLATRRRLIADLWMQLESNDSSGATTGDVIEELRLRVTDHLAAGTPDDISCAERLTAEAICKYAGSGES